MEHGIIIGSQTRHDDTFTSELCDTCGGVIWLPPKLRAILDSAPAEAHIEVLGLMCAAQKYGPLVMDQIMAQRDWQRWPAEPPG